MTQNFRGIFAQKRYIEDIDYYSYYAKEKPLKINFERV